jgi:hypothetical protein
MDYSKKTFKGETVTLDGNTFHQCTFENCELIYKGGKPPAMSGCSFNTPRFKFEGPAADTLAFFAAMYHGGLQVVVDDTFKQIRAGTYGKGKPGN